VKWKLVEEGLRSFDKSVARGNIRKVQIAVAGSADDDSESLTVPVGRDQMKHTLATNGTIEPDLKLKMFIEGCRAVKDSWLAEQSEARLLVWTDVTRS
jgi:hypothetical protein